MTGLGDLGADMNQDPWLQAALRHAPDHDVAVPEAVRNTILTAGRAAVRQPQPAPPRRWWQRGWPQTAPTRLGYSGALVALLVVGLWGVDRLEQPAGAPERPEVLAVPAPMVAPAPTTAQAAAAPAAPAIAAAPDRVARKKEVPPPKATAAQRVTQPEARMAQARAAEAERRRLAFDAAPAAVAAPASAIPPAAVVGAAPANTTAPRMTLGAQRVARADAAVPDPAAAMARNPLAQARLAWQGRTDLRWQTAAGQQGLQGPAQEAWLARLQQALSGPWQAAARPASPPTVQWPGASEGQLWLDAEGQLCLAWAGQVHGAPLPAAEATAMLAELADWR